MEKIINDEEFYQPTLAIIPLNDNNFFYYIIGYYSYMYSSKYRKNLYALILLYYKIDLTNKNNIYINDLQYEIFTSSFWGDEYYFLNQGLSCDYMQDASGYNDYLLACFVIIDDEYPTLSHNFFDATSSKISINNDYYYDYVDELNDVKLIQTVPSISREYELICLLFTDENLECYKFKYTDGFWKDSGSFYQSFTTNFNCRNELYGMKLNYLSNSQNIALSCINSISTVQAMFFDNNLNILNTSEQFTDCESIYGHSVIYSENYSDFYVVSDAVCQNITRSFENLKGSLSKIEVIDIIQPTEKDLLVFEEEEEEKEKDSIEKIEEENEEKTLLEEEEITEIIIQKFDCSGLEKCLECDRESFNNKLCISCNQEKNYYYLNYYPSEPRKNYIDCVNEQTKSSKFYFNKINEDYEPCYSTCASCEYGGNMKKIIALLVME